MSIYWIVFIIFILMLIIGIILAKLKTNYKTYVKTCIISALCIIICSISLMMYNFYYLLNKAECHESIIKNDTLQLLPFDDNNYMFVLNIKNGEIKYYTFNKAKFNKDDFFIFKTKDSLFGINIMKIGICTDENNKNILIKQTIKKVKKSFVKEISIENYDELYYIPIQL